MVRKTPKSQKRKVSKAAAKSTATAKSTASVHGGLRSLIRTIRSKRGLCITLLVLWFAALTNMTYALGSFSILFNVLFSLFLGLLLLITFIVIYRKGNFSFVAYRWYWVFVLLSIGFIVSIYEGVVFKGVTSVVDVFMYLSYHPAYWGLVIAAVAAVAMALYTSTRTLNDLFNWLAYSVIVTDIILLFVYLLLRFVDFPNGSGLIHTLTTSLGLAFGRFDTTLLLPWGDLGTFVLVHIISAIIMIEQFGSFTRKVNFVQLARLFSVMILSLLLWFMVWRSVNVAIFLGILVLGAVLILVFKYRRRRLELLNVVYWILFQSVIAISLYVIVGINWDISAIKLFVTEYAKGTPTLLLNWFTKYETMQRVLNGMLSSPFITYLYGVGPFHSGFVLPVLSFGSQYGQFVAPVVRYFIEFGLFNILVVIAYFIGAIYLIVRHGIERLRAVVLLGVVVLYMLFFYPSLLGWGLVLLVMFYFYEGYAHYYKGVWTLGLYTKGARGGVINHTKHIITLVIALLVLFTGIVAYKLSKAIALMYKIDAAVNELRAKDKLDDKIAYLSHLQGELGRFRQQCGGCVLSNVLYTDVYLQVLDSVTEKELKESKYRDQLTEITAYSFGESYRLNYQLPTASIVLLLGRNYQRLYELTGSIYYWRLSVDYYGKYLIFVPNDVQIALRYARLLVDGINEKNKQIYEPRLAAVLQLLEAYGVRIYQAEGNIGLLWEVTNLRAYYLARLGKQEEARNVYIRFKQLVQNSNIGNKQKSQLLSIIDKIIESLSQKKESVEPDTNTNTQESSKKLR